MRLLAILLLAGLCTPAFAQSPASSPSQPPPASSSGGAMLTPQERETLQTASLKARQDPDVKAAGEKLRDTAKAASDLMAQKDPTVAPLVAKIEAGMIPGAPRPRITQEEGMQLRAARQTIKGSPEDVAWMKASADYRVVMTKAMIAADPAVADILAKFSHFPGMTHAASPAPPVTAAPSVSGTAKP